MNVQYSKTWRQARAILASVLRASLGPLVRLSLRIFRIEILPSLLEGRIGHQIVEPLYLELLRQSRVRNWKIVLVLWDPRQVANDLAFQSLPDSFVMVKSATLRRILNQVMLFVYTRDYPSPTQGIGVEGQAADLFKYTSLIDRNFEFLKIPDERAREFRLRSELGIPRDRWICTFHVREPGPFGDEAIHEYRNSDPNTYISAISEITARGGFVVRIGVNQAQSLAHQESFLQLGPEVRSKGEADLILSRASRFFLGGGSSGAHAMASCNGVPVVGVNVAPLGAVKIWGPRDLAIPKLFRKRSSGELAPFPEVLRSGFGDNRSSQKILNSGFELLDNTPDEIKDLVTEMIDRLEGKHSASSEAEDLQNQFQGLFSPSNYTFHSRTRVGEAFLRKYSHLLK
jgi:putative glycosyltransferase (TIGR04372 family)